MKKIKILSLFLVIVLTLAMFAGCGKKDKAENVDPQKETVVQDDSTSTSTSETTTPTTPAATQTLEDFIKSNPTTMQQVKDSTGGDENMTVDIQGNTVIYTYDFSNMDGVDKATAMTMKEQLDSALEQYGSTFSGLCSTLEGATQIKGIKILVKYTYGDEVISQGEFEAK